MAAAPHTTDTATATASGNHHGCCSAATGNPCFEDEDETLGRRRRRRAFGGHGYFVNVEALTIDDTKTLITAVPSIFHITKI